MYVTSCTIRDEVLLAASFSGGRLLLVDYDKPRVVLDFALPRNCEHKFAFTPDGKTLAASCTVGQRWGVGLYCVDTGQRTWFRAARELICVFVNAGGTGVLYGSTRGVFFARVAGEETIKLTGDLLIGGGESTADCRWHFAPAWRLRGIAKIDMEDGRVELVRPSSGARIDRVKRCPADHTWLVADSEDGITRLSADLEQVMWHRQIGGAGEFCICGNGRWVGVEVHTPPKEIDVLVLDCASGATVRRFEHTRTGSSPLFGSTVLRADGTVLNLETGEESDGVSKPAWWRALGL